MVCENIGGALRPKKARRLWLSLESATTPGAPRRSLCRLSRLLALRPEIPPPLYLPQYAGTLHPGSEPVYQALRRFPLVEDDKCHTLLLTPTAPPNIANLFPYLQQEPIRQTSPIPPLSSRMHEPSPFPSLPPSGGKVRMGVQTSPPPLRVLADAGTHPPPLAPSPSP